MDNTTYIHTCTAAAAAAKSLQPCPTLCDPIDSSPPSPSVPGILQAKAPWSGLPLPSPIQTQTRTYVLTHPVIQICSNLPYFYFLILTHLPNSETVNPAFTIMFSSQVAYSRSGREPSENHPSWAEAQLSHCLLCARSLYL